MKHRWTHLHWRSSRLHWKAKLDRRAYLVANAEWHFFYRSRVQNCTRCGLVKFSVRTNRSYGPGAGWRSFIMPWGGVARFVSRLPGCAPLTDYDAPIGA